MATKRVVDEAYKYAESWIECAYSLVRQARKVIERKETGQEFSNELKAAGSCWAGLHDRNRNASGKITADTLNMAEQVTSPTLSKSCLQMAVDSCKATEVGLLHLLQRRAMECGDAESRPPELIRSYFGDVTQEFLNLHDFDKDKVTIGLARECRIVCDKCGPG